MISTAMWLIGCNAKNSPSTPGTDQSIIAYDIDKMGIPKFVSTNYIDLTKIQSISKFRSSEGHDYSDGAEKCRTMKHYFWPEGGDPGQVHVPSWSTISVYAPVEGSVDRLDEEWAGTQIWIRSRQYPDFFFIIFHVQRKDSLKVGDPIAVGQFVGSHIGDQTMSDIAVGVSTPGGWRLISWFDVLTDSLFHQYQSRGIASREALQISKSERDANPLTCNGETYINGGSLEGWVVLFP